MKKNNASIIVALALGVGFQGNLSAQQTAQMPEVVVHGRSEDLLGVADSANEGYVGAAELAKRPLLRPGEIVETIPGVIVTQHAGGGKANQFFLRGFNLDHGTDLATFIDGVPINQRTHAHGQGYTDLNILIPELVESVEYKKGNYYAQYGDFASAGAFDIHYLDNFARGLVTLEGGQFGYARGVIANSFHIGAGSLLYGLELKHDDGPWNIPDDYQKINGVLRYSQGDESLGFSVTGMAYHGDWHSSDQVAQRAIGHEIGRFGTLDPHDGGDSSRYALSGEWHRKDEYSATKVLLYGAYYDLDLFSDFTYFLNDPVHGDQFEQKDQRVTLGLSAAQTWFGELFGKKIENTVGVQIRHDDIRNGIFHTEDRVRLGTTRQDHTLETNWSGYYENKIAWTDWFRTIAGVRGDVFRFDVDNIAGANSGIKTDGIVSPKLALIFGPWWKTELYLNGGFGFHSNDARGVVAKQDPANPLVRTKGAEVGIRTTAVPNLESSVSLWILDIDSELVFAGDAGTNEPSRPSRRYGIEWANFYTPTPWLTLDADFAFSNARFRETAPEGQRIPGSVETAISAGVAVHDLPGAFNPWFAALRLRYFGPRDLIENGSARSDSTTLVNAQIGYKFNETWSVAVDIFNLFDAKDNDIDYFYTSRLHGEPADGVDDFHSHPVEPRGVRASVTARF